MQVDRYADDPRMVGMYPHDWRSLYPHLHLGVGTAKTAQNRVIYPEVPTQHLLYVVAWPRVDVYSPYRPLSYGLFKACLFGCLFMPFCPMIDLYIYRSYSTFELAMASDIHRPYPADQPS